MTPSVVQAWLRAEAVAAFVAGLALYGWVGGPCSGGSVVSGASGATPVAIAGAVLGRIGRERGVGQS